MPITGIPVFIRGHSHLDPPTVSCRAGAHIAIWSFTLEEATVRRDLVASLGSPSWQDTDLGPKSCPFILGYLSKIGSRNSRRIAALDATSFDFKLLNII